MKRWVPAPILSIHHVGVEVIYTLKSLRRKLRGYADFGNQ